MPVYNSLKIKIAWAKKKKKHLEKSRNASELGKLMRTCWRDLAIQNFVEPFYTTEVWVILQQVSVGQYTADDRSYLCHVTETTAAITTRLVVARQVAHRPCH